jgi:hypothetical protein
MRKLRLYVLVAILVGTSAAATQTISPDTPFECPTICNNGGTLNPSADKLTCCSCPTGYAQPNCSHIDTAMIKLVIYATNESTATLVARFSSEVFMENIRKSPMLPFAGNITGGELLFVGVELNIVTPDEVIPITINVMASRAWGFVARVSTDITYRQNISVPYAYFVGPKLDSAPGPFSVGYAWVLYRVSVAGYDVPLEARAVGYVAVAVIGCLLLFPVLEGLMRKCCGGEDEDEEKREYDDDEYQFDAFGDRIYAEHSEAKDDTEPSDEEQAAGRAGWVRHKRSQRRRRSLKNGDAADLDEQKTRNAKASDKKRAKASAARRAAYEEGAPDKYVTDSDDDSQSDEEGSEEEDE